MSRKREFYKCIEKGIFLMVGEKEFYDFLFSLDSLKSETYFYNGDYLYNGGYTHGFYLTRYFDKEGVCVAKTYIHLKEGEIQL